MPRRSLNETEERQLREAYELYRQNQPARLARRFNIGISTLYAYIRGEHKRRRRDGPARW